jgi:hypothetical protein
MLSLGLSAVPIQLSGGVIAVPVCTKSVWDKIRTCDKSEAAMRYIGGVLLPDTPLDICDLRLFITVYRDNLLKIREETGLSVPYYPNNDKDDKYAIKYTIYTQSDKLVSDYANMSIYDVDNISIIDYWLLERDAFIFALSKTEKGCELLNNAYRLTQTEADEDLDIK